MPYSKVPKDHTEFGGGPGLIDPMNRADRTLTPEEELIEIYATDPAPPRSGHIPADPEVMPLGPENFQETATIERPRAQ
jgi:hypothetical protein